MLASQPLCPDSIELVFELLEKKITHLRRTASLSTGMKTWWPDMIFAAKNPVKFAAVRLPLWPRKMSELRSLLETLKRKNWKINLRILIRSLLKRAQDWKCIKYMHEKMDPDTYGLKLHIHELLLMIYMYQLLLFIFTLCTNKISVSSCDFWNFTSLFVKHYL